MYISVLNNNTTITVTCIKLFYDVWVSMKTVCCLAFFLTYRKISGRRNIFLVILIRKWVCKWWQISIGTPYCRSNEEFINICILYSFVVCSKSIMLNLGVSWVTTVKKNYKDIRPIVKYIRDLSSVPLKLICTPVDLTTLVLNVSCE